MEVLFENKWSVDIEKDSTLLASPEGWLQIDFGFKRLNNESDFNSRDNVDFPVLSIHSR